MSFFRFDNLQFDYEPFPIGYQRDVVNPEFYERMVAAWPAQEHFCYMPALGLKYSLSERNHPDEYSRVVKSDPVWNAVWQEIKSTDFIDRVIEGLRKQHIDLGIPPQSRFGDLKQRSLTELLWLRLSRRKASRLRSRFEFSMMPSTGGCIKPHTDAPQKLITLVYSIVTAGKWNPAWGGGTDVLRVKESRHSFNHVNRQAEFSEVDVIKTFEFVPNQLVVFVKTFNSWHAVRPMTGDTPHAMRRTLTINIEASSDF